MLQNATNAFLNLMQQTTDSVSSQAIINLRSASMGTYYKCQELPDHLCLTRTNMSGKELATPNKTDYIPYKITPVAHLAQYALPRGVKGAANQRTQEKKERNKKGEKRPHRPNRYCCQNSTCALADFKMWHFTQSMWKVITKAGGCSRIVITLALTRRMIDLGSRQPSRVRAFVSCLVLRISAPFTPVLVQHPAQTAWKKLYKHCSLLGWATITVRYSPNTYFGSCCSHGLK